MSRTYVAVHWLQWLPSKQKVQYKVIMLTFKDLKGLAPNYLLVFVMKYHPVTSPRSSRHFSLIVHRTRQQSVGDCVSSAVYLSIYPIVLGTVGAQHDLATNIRHSSRSSAPHGVAQFQTRPIPDVIFPSFSVSASPSPSPYSALEDCIGKSRSSCDWPIPLHFASFYNGHEFFVWSNGLPNPASHLFDGYGVFVRDTKETSETSHFHCLYLSLYFCC